MPEPTAEELARRLLELAADPNARAILAALIDEGPVPLSRIRARTGLPREAARNHVATMLARRVARESRAGRYTDRVHYAIDPAVASAALAGLSGVLGVPEAASVA